MANEAIIRFSGYQLDPAARSLKYQGRPVALGPKTFDLLFFLASHPHQVVAKEDLLNGVWPDSFVEESNLSQHVFLLRKALGTIDSSEQIVVTVPGKGYQFAATVEELPRLSPGRPAADQGQGELLIHAVQSLTRLVVEEVNVEEEPAQLALPAPRKRRWWLVWAGASAALLLVGAGVFLGWRRLHPARAEHVELVLAEIENRTGDSDFDSTLKEALRIDLQQSPYLSLLSRSRIAETLASMQHSKDEKLTAAVAQEICERNNGQAVLHGTISQLGKKYVFLLDADSCVNGEPIASFKADAGSKEEVLTALDRAAGQIRRQLGESGSSRQRFQVPIASVSTPSLDALRAYSEGNQSFNQGDMKTAETLYQRAIQLDPNFASAYKSLGWTYFNDSEPSRAAEASTKAYNLRERTSERERLNIETTYYYLGTGDLEAAVRSLKLYLDVFPDSAANWGNLCTLYTRLGQSDAAIKAGEHAWQLDSNSGFVAESLARAYERAGRFADAKAVAAKSIAEGSDRWGTHSVLYQIAFSEHAPDRMATETDWGLMHGPRHVVLYEMAMAAASRGKLRQADDTFARSRSESMRQGNQEYAEGVQLDQAAVFLELEEPQKAAVLISQIKNDPGSPHGLMALQAQLGNLASAQRYLAAARPEQDADTIQIFRDVPLLRATMAFESRKPADAVQSLEPARPYQWRDFDVPYLRARAESEAGNLDAAAADYRLILGRPGVNPISPLYPLSHLRLARVLAQQKKPDEARQQYRVFLEAWKDADPDLRIVAAARREVAQLH